MVFYDRKSIMQSAPRNPAFSAFARSIDLQPNENNACIATGNLPHRYGKRIREYGMQTSRWLLKWRMKR